MTPQPLGDLVGRVTTYHPNADIDLIEKAYEYSQWAHREQTRKSGDPYFIHPASVAGIIADLRLDHGQRLRRSAARRGGGHGYESRRHRARFRRRNRRPRRRGDQARQINFTSREDRQAESFRKMVIAMAKDIRVLLVKLCDRLDNMRTMEHMKPASQERISRETMEIYAPLANRLGLHQIKSELEDLSFRYVDPHAYAEIVGKLVTSKRERERYIDGVCRTLTSRLAEAGFAAEVTGRAKHIYSVHRKMMHNKCDFEQIYDLIAFVSVWNP